MEPTSTEEDLVDIADAFENSEFSPVELVAIKRTRRRSPRLGEAKAKVQTYPYEKVVIDDSRGEIVGYWSQITPC